jgi:uncharacterized protein YbbC (DUF1343 family)
VNRAAFLAAGAATAALAAAPAGVRAAAPTVTLGDDVLVREGWHALRGRAVGIITNPSGALSTGVSVVDAVVGLGSVHVRALFGPEHGIRGTTGAGEHVDSSVDAKTGLPVRSLYGATRKPTAAMLEGIDVLLFDVQDVGARPYTYISTMAYVMQAAAAYGKEVWILDRPNPVGGTLVDGPVLDPHFASFIGLYPIPERHGMTVGELARLFNDQFGIGCALHVVPMEGWAREMVWADTGLTWIPTSPNMPYARTTLVYLATGLVESGGVNNGVGTDRPFEYAGGYGFDPAALRDALTARRIPGVEFEPTEWSPARGFWAGKELRGVQLNLTEPRVFPSVRTAVEILCAARAQGKYAVEAATGMDRDWGTDTIRRSLTAGASPEAILAAWEPGLHAFRTLRERYLLY